MRRMTIQVPAYLYEQLRREAFRQRCSMAELVRRALGSEMAKHTSGEMERRRGNEDKGQDA